MTREELLARLASLRQARVGQVRVPHKPLLLLWLFGHFAATGSSAASYQQAEEPVSQLINDFGPPVASAAAARQRAAMPFVHLERELWDLRDAAGRELGPDAPERRAWLLERPGRYCRAGRETMPRSCLPVPPFPGSWLDSVAGTACLHRPAPSDSASHQLVTGAVTGQGLRSGQRREGAVAARQQAGGRCCGIRSPGVVARAVTALGRRRGDRHRTGNSIGTARSSPRCDRRGRCPDRA